MRRSLKFIALILVFILLTGCWDKVEINDRAYIIAIGIDVTADKDEEDKELYRITYTTPNLSVITGQGSGPSRFIKSVEESSLFGAYKKLSTRLNKQLNFDHTKVIIFGKSLLEHTGHLKEVLDHLNRNSMYARTLFVLTTDGTANELISLSPEGQVPTGLYITQMYQNNEKETLRSFSVHLGELVNQLRGSKGNGLIPKIVPGDKDLEIGGAAVVKEYALIGWLNDKDMRSIGWMKGEGKGSQMWIRENDVVIPYEISSSDASMEFKAEQGRLSIDITVNSEGDITEYIMDPKDELFKDKIISELEKKIETKMEEEMQGAVKRIQGEFGVDCINTQDRLKGKDKKLYLETKDDWDSAFSAAKITVKSNVHIRRIGMIK